MFTTVLLLQTRVALKNALVALILLFTRSYMDNLQCTCCSPTFTAGTWTSAWASPCWSPWSPWSTAPCPASAGRLLFSSYLGGILQLSSSVNLVLLPQFFFSSYRCFFSRFLYLRYNIFYTIYDFNQLAVWRPLLAIGFGSSTSSI